MSFFYSLGDSFDEKWEVFRVSDGFLRWTRKNSRRLVFMGRKCLFGFLYFGDGTYMFLCGKFMESFL